TSVRGKAIQRELCRVGDPFPVAAWQFNDLATVAFQFRGAIVALDILRCPREGIDQSPSCQRTASREVLEHALSFGLGQTKLLSGHLDCSGRIARDRLLGSLL